VLMWGYIYGDQFGLTRNLNDLLGGTFVQPFVPEWMLLSIGNIVTWQFVGYNMLIFYSSLKTIPGELYEAASIDGAGAWRTIFSIKIPAV
ncbi:carbohydrate ABC transporter permease, partial [Vibrio parahaemolyticus]